MAASIWIARLILSHFSDKKAIKKPHLKVSMMTIIIRMAVKNSAANTPG